MSPCIHPPRPEHFGLPPHGESRSAHDAPEAGGNATVSHEAGIAEAMATLRRACAGERAPDAEDLWLVTTETGALPGTGLGKVDLLLAIIVTIALVVLGLW